MAPLQELFLCCLTVASVAQMSRGFLSVTVGETITLFCSSVNDTQIGARLFWYKQSLGTKPELISTFSKYDKKGKFHGEFRKRKHAKLDNENGRNVLHISNTVLSDSAVYHCVRCFLHQSEFLESITVLVRSLDVQAEIVQTPHEDTEEGQSVILKCSVHMGRDCEGQHRVHWFRQSGQSSAGVLYSQGGGDSDQCQKTTKSPTKSCVYSLPIHNMSPEQAGDYYCAVDACGQVLFGSGTKVCLKEVDLGVYVWSGALAFCCVLIVGLLFSLCRMKKKYSRLCTELKRQSRTAATMRRETAFPPFCQDGNQEVDSLNYAALNIHPTSRRQRMSEQTDCVYSRVQLD